TLVRDRLVSGLRRSSLEQFNAPEIQVVTFDTYVPNRGNTGLLSWGQWTTDMDWTSSALQPICDNATEIMNRTEISAPSWRVQGFKTARGIVVVKGGGYVNAVCLNPRTGAFRTVRLALNASVELRYPLPFDKDNWMDQTPTVTKEGVMLAPSWNMNDHLWGMAQTFSILSTQHDKTSMKAGETLKSTFRVRSTDGWRPQGCTLFIVGTQYSVITQDTIPGVNYYDSCKLTDLGGNEWQVDGSVRIPTNARPDRYYVPLIIFQDSQTDRDAIPLMPVQVVVENPTAPAAPTIRSLVIRGLQPASMLGFDLVTNSFLANAGDKFEVEFIVEGKTLATEDLWLDATFLYPTPSGKFGYLLGSGSSISLPAMLTKTDVIYVANGTRVTMQWTMPTMLSTVEVAAIKFNRFYLRTYDYSWAEIEMPGVFDSMVINPKYGK
ncbi:MAG: VCBS domain-containing protein, partial [Bdellovibrionota bacterium]